MKAIDRIDQHYRSIKESPQNEIQHDYPFQTSFVDCMGLRTNFTYTDRINSNLVFDAVSISEAKDRLIVKFVRQYSEDAHRFLDDLGYAPTLRAINSISGGWKMIVMDYSRYTELSKVTAELDNITKLAIKQRVKEIIEKLHAKELVHGDIRQANILVDRTTLGSPEGVSLQLIDFDWAGPAGAVKYPMRLNTKTVRRPKHVAGGKLITKSDDLEMIDLLFEESLWVSAFQQVLVQPPWANSTRDRMTMAVQTANIDIVSEGSES